MLKYVLSLIVGLSLAGTLSAQCVYNGVIYSEGAIIGPYICHNGQWVKR